MFYDPRDPKGHGLPHDPFKSLIAPRPIGWISTLSDDGKVNLAPYSFFNAVCYPPYIVMFSSSELVDDPRKHSRRNAEDTGEFVCNLVSAELTDAMHMTAAHVDRDVDELAMAGLTTEPSVTVKPPRVRESPAHLECRYMQTVILESDTPGSTHGVVFGEVTGIHISDTVMTDGLVDITKLRPVARLGYRDYTIVEDGFSKPSYDSMVPGLVKESS